MEGMEIAAENVPLEYLRSKRILITGAGGFVGANLTRYLVRCGCTPHILLKQASKYWRLQDIINSTAVHYCDIKDFGQVKQLVKEIKPDIVYHLAAYGGYPTAQQDLWAIVETNIKGTLNLLTALSDEKYELFVNTGSSSEYGLKNVPMVETDLLEPVNYYGVSKASASLFAQVFAKQKGQPIVTLRLFSVYGSYEEPMRLIPYLISSCLKNNDINLTGGDQVRDFIFVDDVIEAYIKLMLVPKIAGEVINIGSGKQYTIKEAAGIVTRSLGFKGRLNCGVLPYRDNEPKFWSADISKAKILFNWEPRTTFENGLSITIEWFKRNIKYY